MHSDEQIQALHTQIEQALTTIQNGCQLYQQAFERGVALIAAHASRIEALAQLGQNPNLLKVMENSLASFKAGADQIVGIDMAQQITGKARSTIYRLAAEGKIPSAKNGGRVVFSETALKAFAFQVRAMEMNMKPIEPKMAPLPDDYTPIKTILIRGEH